MINIALLNARSVRNKTCIIRDYITENHIDIFCLTETWLNKNDNAVIAEFVPETHVLHHSPREGRGGGVGVVINRKFQGVKSKTKKYQYFECLELSLNHRNKLVYIYVIYTGCCVSRCIVLNLNNSLSFPNIFINGV